MTDTGFVPQDPELPGLAGLFAQDGPPQHVVAAAARLSERTPGARVERTYTRYWPGRRCVVQWTYETPAGEPPFVVSAEYLSVREARKSRDGVGEYLASQRTWVQVYPYDRVLPAIATAVSPDWIGSKLAPAVGVDPSIVTARPVSYKSWRRCVLEYSAGERKVYGKLFRDGRGEALAHRLDDLRNRLAAAGLPWTIPETIFYDADTQMLLQEELPEGASVSTLLPRTPDDPAVLDEVLGLVREAASMLTALQSLDLDDVETFAGHDAFTSLQTDVAALRSVDEDIGYQLYRRQRSLEKMFKGFEPEQLTLAHSAFRHSHLYTTENGLALLDLDNLRLSGASADAGYFLGYLAYSGIRRPRLRETFDRCADTFMEAWRQQPSFNANWLGFYSGYVLLKWAIRSFYSLDPNWRRTVSTAIQVAQKSFHDVMEGQRSEVIDPLLAIAGRRRALMAFLEGPVATALFGGASVSFDDVDMAYDPGEQAVINASVKFAGGDGNDARVIVTFQSPEATSRAVETGAVAAGPHVFVDEAQGVIAETFPHDHRLPGLARSLDDEHMLGLFINADIVTDHSPVKAFKHEILRFRPHERCVVRYTLTYQDGSVQQFVAKVYNDDITTQEVWTTLTSLRSQLADPVLVVQPLVKDDDNFIVVMENIVGGRVGDLIEETTDPDEVRRYVEMTADALARLHALSLVHDRIKTFETEIEKLREHERSAGSVSDEMGQALRQTLDAIEVMGSKLPEVPARFVHGGFKPTQMLLRPNGEVTVVDFDGSCLGDPTIDVGRFMAKIRVDCMDPLRVHLQGLDQFFLDAYSARSSIDVRDRARIFQAMSLVRMSSRRFETRIGAFQYGGLSARPSGAMLREAMACLELVTGNQ